MTHRYEIFIDRSKDPSTTGSSRYADLTAREANRLRDILQAAFDLGKINDYSVEQDDDNVMSFSSAFAWVTQLVSR